MNQFPEVYLSESSKIRVITSESQVIKKLFFISQVLIDFWLLMKFD